MPEISKEGETRVDDAMFLQHLFFALGYAVLLGSAPWIQVLKQFIKHTINCILQNMEKRWYKARIWNVVPLF